MWKGIKNIIGGVVRAAEIEHLLGFCGLCRAKLKVGWIPAKTASSILHGSTTP